MSQHVSVGVRKQRVHKPLSADWLANQHISFKDARAAAPFHRAETRRLVFRAQWPASGESKRHRRLARIGGGSGRPRVFWSAKSSNNCRRPSFNISSAKSGSASTTARDSIKVPTNRLKNEIAFLLRSLLFVPLSASARQSRFDATPSA